MKIIDNINGTHNQSIQQMLSCADKMFLVSPFLTEDFGEFIYDVAGLGVKSIVLITTLRDKSPDLFKKANSLYSFCTSCIQNRINYEVRVDNKLHGKLYIAVKDGIPIRGIISSANFTDNGLSNSHEWGVEINDSHMLENIVKDLMKVSTSPLTYKEIEAIIKTIDDYLKENPILHEQKPKLDVTQHIKGKLKAEVTKMSSAPIFGSDVRYFLKPVGSSDQPFDESQKLSDTIQQLSFARRPNAVRVGDILICYGVGTTKLIGYFRVLSQPLYLTGENRRWPWEVNAENICPNYSSNWSLNNNTLSRVQASYGNDKKLTFVGGKTLGALNFGADKVRLNEEFAQHLINIIEK